VPARDWKALPANPERVRRMADLLRREFGAYAARKVESWMAESADPHWGIGVTFPDLLAEIRMQDGLGLKPTPRPEKMRWTNNEIFGPSKNRGKL
jgi:hypothetical protein